MWTFERVGWLVMLAIVLAAIAGLTGRGGLLETVRVKVGDRVVTDLERGD